MDVLVKCINAVKAYFFFYVPLYLLPITAFWKFNKTKYKIFTKWQVWIFVGRGWLLLLYKSIRIFDKKKKKYAFLSNTRVYYIITAYYKHQVNDRESCEILGKSIFKSRISGSEFKNSFPKVFAARFRRLRVVYVVDVFAVVIITKS